MRVVIAERRLKGVLAVASDGLPPQSIAVSAAVGVWIYQETGEGVLADSFKEISHPWPRSERGLKRCYVFVKRGQDLVLLFRRGRRELVHTGKKLVNPVLQFGQTLGINPLVFTGERFQGAIDEVNDPSLAGTRRTVGRDDACGHSVDFRCLFGGKEFKVWWNSRARRLARMVYCGESSGPVRSNPGGRSGADTVDKKLSARRCVLHSKVQSEPSLKLYGPSREDVKRRSSPSFRGPPVLSAIWKP